MEDHRQDHGQDRGTVEAAEAATAGTGRRPIRRRSEDAPRRHPNRSAGRAHRGPRPRLRRHAEPGRQVGWCVATEPRIGVPDACSSSKTKGSCARPSVTASGCSRSPMRDGPKRPSASSRPAELRGRSPARAGRGNREVREAFAQLFQAFKQISQRRNSRAGRAWARHRDRSPQAALPNPRRGVTAARSRVERGRPRVFIQKQEPAPLLRL